MWVSVCTCVCVNEWMTVSMYVSCQKACVWIWMRVSECVCVCVCVNEWEWVNVCVCVCVCEWMRVSECACVCVCECVCEWMRVSECVCVCMCVCVNEWEWVNVCVCVCVCVNEWINESDWVREREKERFLKSGRERERERIKQLKRDGERQHCKGISERRTWLPPSRLQSPPCLCRRGSAAGSAVLRRSQQGCSTGPESPACRRVPPVPHPQGDSLVEQINRTRHSAGPAGVPPQRGWDSLPPPPPGAVITALPPFSGPEFPRECGLVRFPWLVCDHIPRVPLSARRSYDAHFLPGKKVWVVNPPWEDGRSPKPDREREGPHYPKAQLSKGPSSSYPSYFYHMISPAFCNLM